jgi:hypothetical protein
MWDWRARLHMYTMNQGLRATSCLYKATHSPAYHCKSFSQHRARTPSHNSPFPPVGAKGLERKRSCSQASLTRKQAHHCDSSNCWLSCIACVGKFLWPYYIICSSPFSCRNGRPISAAPLGIRVRPPRYIIFIYIITVSLNKSRKAINRAYIFIYLSILFN